MDIPLVLDGKAGLGERIGQEAVGLLLPALDEHVAEHRNRTTPRAMVTQLGRDRDGPFEVRGSAFQTAGVDGIG